MKAGDQVRVKGGAHDGRLALIVALNGTSVKCRFYSPVQRRSGTWTEETWVARRQLVVVPESAGSLSDCSAGELS